VFDPLLNIKLAFEHIEQIGDDNISVADLITVLKACAPESDPMHSRGGGGGSDDGGGGGGDDDDEAAAAARAFIEEECAIDAKTATCRRDVVLERLAERYRS
jgi:hypothetical protein